ncbi:MAG TPA: TonB family protein [Sphingobium sp.]|nr:TonB family protein [Sphingobium sp.]
MTAASQAALVPVIDPGDPQQTGLWGKAFAAVLALHLAAAMVAAAWQGASIAPLEPEMSIALDLAPLPSADEPVAAQAAAAAPLPMRQERPVPIERPQPLVQPEMPVPVIAPHVPVPVRAAVAAAPAAGPSAPAEANSGNGTAGGGVEGSADRAATNGTGRGRGERGGGDEAAAWRGRVLAHLDRHKRYPAAAKMMKREGRVQLNLTMDRRGHVLAVSVGRGAGFKALDDEAVAVVKRAQPLPLPPPAVEGEAIPMQVPIGFALGAAR